MPKAFSSLVLRMADHAQPERAPGALAGLIGTKQQGRSVYGLRVIGLDDVAELANSADERDDDLIPVRVSRSIDRPPHLHELDGERNIRALPAGRHLHLERAAGRATFYGPSISTDQLAHPYLGVIAVIFNRWGGREIFHAGAFVAAGHAWMVLGPRTAGKSTLTAALAAAQVPILTDDLAVTDGTTVWAGPRSIDLREALPALVLTSRPTDQTVPAVSPSRLGTRLRLTLPAVAAQWPLGGWFFLHWDDRSQVKPVALTELLGRLATMRSLRMLPSDRTRILSLASRPAWDFRRRRDWSALPATVDTLLDTVNQAVCVPSQ